MEFQSAREVRIAAEVGTLLQGLLWSAVAVAAPVVPVAVAGLTDALGLPASEVKPPWALAACWVFLGHCRAHPHAVLQDHHVVS